MWWRRNNRPKRCYRAWGSLITLAAVLGGVGPAVCQDQAGDDRLSGLGAYISTGDNHWLASWLPIDSPEAIESSFDLLARLGVRRVYWRGLEEAAWLETADVREENCRYASFWRWVRQLYGEVNPDRAAVEAAHRRGMEIWGASALFDWGSSADAPCFGDFPHQAESRLRLDHPEWVPVDRSGLLRQGGPIELAYPEARQALVDLHAKLVRRDGYDGVLFLTYAENYSTRFQDEFGFNDPIVEEFKRRTGVDLRTQPFTRTGSRYDWYALRGRYVTQFLRELRVELEKDGTKLGFFVNPQQPHFPQPWNVPELMLTAGHVYLDLERWIREGLVDQLLVYGYCHPAMQQRALENCLWMTRETKTRVSALTSSPAADQWAPFRERGVQVVMALHDEAMYLDRAGLGEQSLDALSSPDPVLRMRILSQIVSGTTKATVADVAPLAEDENLLVRRLAMLALGKLKDPSAVPILEKNLDDPRHAVRCVAALALRDVNRPASAARLLAAVRQWGNHPLNEIVVTTLARIAPAPREELAAAAVDDDHPTVRTVAMRALVPLANRDLLPTFIQGLSDSDRYVRFAAAVALGNVRKSPEAIQALVEATRHEDPVVSDRAATSLGLVYERHEEETDPLRPQVLAALKDLYAQLGDGCCRADAEWGYRPVGNALLKLGSEGESVLRQFMEQTTDRRLADQAWRSLYIRQDNGTFSEVTEQENEAALKKRPAWLDVP
jgi:HEAT repeat protein